MCKGDWPGLNMPNRGFCSILYCMYKIICTYLLEIKALVLLAWCWNTPSIIPLYLPTCNHKFTVAPSIVMRHTFIFNMPTSNGHRILLIYRCRREQTSIREYGIGAHKYGSVPGCALYLTHIYGSRRMTCNAQGLLSFHLKNYLLSQEKICQYWKILENFFWHILNIIGIFGFCIFWTAGVPDIKISRGWQMVIFELSFWFGVIAL